MCTSCFPSFVLVFFGQERLFLGHKMRDLRGEGCGNIYISSNLHPSPKLYVAAQYGSRITGKGATWCIHLAEGAKLHQNGLKMCPFHLFEHPEWSKIHFGKWRFSPMFDPFLVPNWPILKAFWDYPWAKTCSNGLTTG